jgi:Polyketide cyclase / dehydrase and lipid transport
MFTCEAVDLDYLDTAPIRLSASINVDRPPSEVFAALAHDPANWGEFFPGFDRTGHFNTPAPHGVGSRYTKRFIGIKIDEQVLVWDEGARLAFRVDSTTAPVFHAWVEDYRCESNGDGGTLLRVAIGGNGRPPVKLAAPVLPRVFPRVMTRVGRNLERGRWFSTPRINP